MLMVLQRKEYLDKLIAFKDKQLIKVVTGIRRCGKSTLLEIYQNWLLEQGIPKTICIFKRTAGSGKNDLYFPR